jgi:hypothetical protein
MSAIQLNFINRSNDKNNSDIVIFSKNRATDFEELAVAWIVIKNCGQGFNHPFSYPLESTVSVSDSYGNYSPELPASPGQAFTFSTDSSGDVLKLSGNASGHEETDVVNGLEKGSINAGIWKNRRLYATKIDITPGQKAVFEFTPTIFIGAVSQVEEGQIMNSAIISSINTELNLLGIASADIVMTGGGPGPTSTPFIFTFENVEYA